MRESLIPGAAHVWLCVPESVGDPQLLARYASLLNEDERRRWQRFRFERHRHQFLVTRALARLTLSAYAQIAPQDWRFVTNAYGKPSIDPALFDRAGAAGLEFNLSHADGLIACALTRDAAIGVDVESCVRDAQTVAVANRFFSASECAALGRLPEAERHVRFFDYWTLKEAYIKARGMGLALPLGQFSFELETVNQITLHFGEKIRDDPQRWRFLLTRPTPSHRLALCLEQLDAAATTLGAPPHAVTIRHCVPGASRATSCSASP